MAAMPSWFLYAFIPLVLWRIYARVRRNIGRQRSKAWRHWLGVTLFPAYIGVGLSLLLVGRILYRMTQLYGALNL